MRVFLRSIPKCGAKRNAANINPPRMTRQALPSSLMNAQAEMENNYCGAYDPHRHRRACPGQPRLCIDMFDIHDSVSALGRGCLAQGLHLGPPETGPESRA